MERKRTTLAGTAVIVCLALLASPALAHRKSNPHYPGAGRRMWVYHSHCPEETVAEDKCFDPVGGAGSIIVGAAKAIGGAFESVFCCKA